jgi:hemolysin activation/secretion protein
MPLLRSNARQFIDAALLVLLLAGAPLPSVAASHALLSAPFITGSTRYSATDFVPVFAERIGEPVTRRLLDDIEAQIQAMYQRDDLVAPIIVVPDGELLSTTPRLHVFEAAIDEIALRGDAGPYTETLMDRAAELRTGLLEERRTRALVQQLNRLPGLSVKASFEPRGLQPNRLTLVFTSQYKPIEGAMSVNNRGTAALGRTLISGRITANGVLDSAVSVFASTSDEVDRYRFVGASVERHLSSLLGRLDVASTEAKFDDRYEYRSERARLQLIAAGWQRSGMRWQPVIGFMARDARGAYPGEVLSDMRTRAASLGLISVYSGESTSAYSRATVTQGLNEFGASSYVRRGAAPQRDFSKSTLELSLVHVIAPTWQLRLDLDGQYSDSNLPAAERFTFGGASLGRAFDPAELMGDAGAAVGVQLERTQRWHAGWLSRSTIYMQSDYGYAHDNDLGDDDAASISAGLKLAFASMLASLEVSRPVLRAQTQPHASDVRAFAQLQISF